MTAPAIGWYGDDFTGATDTLAVAASAGLRARLFLRVPGPDLLAQAGPLDAIGIAGAARAMAPDAMAAELAPVARFFAEAGCRVVHYKCCSTFDSAPGTGSLGEAVRAFKPFCPNSLVPIVGGQPNLGRFCAFSTLFAAAGQGGAVVRIDRHPTMSRHPVTPMTEADLRLHLGAQGLRVAAVHAPDYALDDDALAASLRSRIGDGADAVLFDVVDDAHLARIGRLLWRAAEDGPLLAIGGSSVVQALTLARPHSPARQGAFNAPHAEVARETGPRSTGDRPASFEASLREAGQDENRDASNIGPQEMPARRPALAPAGGPVFVLVGSLSPVTRRQVEAARRYRHVAIDVERLLVDGGVTEAAEGIGACLAAGDNVMATTAVPDGPAVPSGRAAAATAALARRVFGGATLGRAAFAGGDTSSYATLGLGLDSLSFLSTLAPGVALCRTHAGDPKLDGIELALKGGQMGPPDLFDLLVTGDAARV